MIVPSGDFSDAVGDSIVLEEQPRTAVFFNVNGVIAIRQEGDETDPDDAVVIIATAANARAVARMLLDLAEQWEPEAKPKARSKGADRQRRYIERKRQQASADDGKGVTTRRQDDDDLPELPGFLDRRASDKCAAG